MSRDRHPIERAAPYVAGELTPTEVEAFEHHLRVCETCRAEVTAGRRGQALARQGHETAPARLHARIAGAVAAGQTPQRGRRLRLVVVAAAVLVVIAGLTAAERLVGPGLDPVAAAVSDYRQGRLPGSTPTPAPAPDLAALGLTHIAAGGGELDGQPVTAFAYRDRVGRRVTVYLSDRTFPMPDDADQAAGPGGPWSVSRHGVSVVCVSELHEVLVVGGDWELVDAVADRLDVS